MLIVLSILVYVVALVTANFTIAKFGVVMAPINAFLFIGLDLTLRDWLHAKISRPQMLLLILAAGACSYLLDPATGRFAVASVLAFVLAGAADYAAFGALAGQSWLRRSVGSNVVGAVVDSLVFMLAAFGGVDPVIAAQMIGAKILGSTIWALLFNGLRRT